MPSVPFSSSIVIGEKTLSLDKPTYFIAEIGANFDGDLDKAKRLALAAKEAGADCAKFQSFLADRIVSAKGFASMHLKGVHGTWDKSVFDVFRGAEFPRAWHKELSDYCKSIGIHFSSAPYDREAVDLLVSLDVPFIKIGSGEITWLEMLTYIAKTGKPLMLATGDSTLAEVDEALATIQAAGNNNLILMQCITNYPSKIESANIRVIETYQKAFGILTGYSDHSPGMVVTLGAVALGARVIEKHFTLSKRDAGPDHPHSMEPAEFRAMVDATRALERALGSSRKEVVAEEDETVIVQRRGLCAKRTIAQGAVITAEDVDVLRPALGILPKFKSVIIGRIAGQTIEEGTPIRWEHLS